VLLEFNAILSGSRGWLENPPDFVEPPNWQKEGVCQVRIIPEWLDQDERGRLSALQRSVAWVRGRLHSGDPGARQSDCGWIKPERSTRWLYRKLASTFVEQNRRYRFDLSGFNEGPQFVRYRTGGVLDWHTDIGVGPSSVRKLALIALVDRSEDCEGGELEFLPVSHSLARIAPGTALVFPPFIAHRVTRITRGSRLALVAWACGPAFK
jgi:PKHD-type hydroxylase